MPDRHQEMAPGDRVDDRRPLHGWRRSRTGKTCDFTAALLHELASELALMPYDDPRFEALAAEETAILWRALAGEMGAGCPSKQARRARWFLAARGRLKSVSARCTRVIALSLAPICSMLLNTDVLAVARRLCAGLAVRRRS